MENLFDVINNGMFSVFARKDKRANYDLLSTLYDIFTKEDRFQNIVKEDLKDKITAYIKGRDFDELDDADNVSLLGKSAREKASYKIGQFIKCGWLEEENSKGLEYIITLSDNAILLLETFRMIVSKREQPLEYTGYFYVIYETLRNFDYQKSKALVEQIVKNTNELFNSLQGLHSEIKRFIKKLINRTDLTPQDVLDLLLNKYQDQVILTVFNNLKGRDNPSKYTSEILGKLKWIRYENFDKVVSNYIATANIKELTNEKYEEIERKLERELDEVIASFESVDQFVSIIDYKNSKFHGSALATLNFIMNNRRDIEGQIDKALRILQNVSDGEDFEEILEIYSCGNIDDKSLHSRNYNREKKSETFTEIPEISENEVKTGFEAIFQDDEYSRNKINEFVVNLLGNRNSIEISDIPITGMEEFMKIVMIQIYSEYKEMDYYIEYNGSKQGIYGYSMESFYVFRRKAL